MQLEYQPLNDVFPNTALWKKCRKLCTVTCSDYASAINCDGAYESRIKLYKVKKGLKSNEPSAMTEAHWENGHYQEELAVQWFESQGDEDIKFFRPGFWIDPSDSRLGGSPDGVLQIGESLHVVEIKNPDTMIERAEDVPWRHIIQLMGLMHASGIESGVLCYFQAGRAPNLFGVAYDEDIWAKIYKELMVFMNCLERDILPPSPAPKIFKKEKHAGDLLDIVMKCKDLNILFSNE
jgi:hypothetical protein